MEQGNFANLGTQGEGNNQVFLLEILMPGQKGTFARRSRSQIVLKVPKERMSQEVKRIIRQGGKILSIKPLVSEEDNRQEPISMLPWWVEISTTHPKCLYYFGPFDSFTEAQSYQSGYVEDLEEEGTEGIAVEIKQCQPNILTQEF